MSKQSNMSARPRRGGARALVPLLLLVLLSAAGCGIGAPKGEVVEEGHWRLVLPASWNPGKVYGAAEWTKAYDGDGMHLEISGRHDTDSLAIGPLNDLAMGGTLQGVKEFQPQPIEDITVQGAGQAKVMRFSFRGASGETHRGIWICATNSQPSPASALLSIISDGSDLDEAVLDDILKSLEWRR